MRPVAILLACLAGCSKPPPPPPAAPPAPSTPASRAVDYLMSQGAEGLWKSKDNSALGSGQALTPFVLYALSHALPETLARHRPAIEKALDRLPIVGGEYPAYSIALSILALKKLRPTKDVGGLCKELKSMQLAEELGWSEADPEYGGWDEGVITARKPQCQRPNVSVTAFACEALGGDEKAKKFVERCRGAEGGYLFTPNALWAHQNKSGKMGYATATFDAHRILGTPPVTKISDLPHFLDMPEKWGRSMVYYQAFAEAKVHPNRTIAEMLLALQQKDGSWVNTSPLMKEDEPLIATGLALVAISLSR